MFVYVHVKQKRVLANNTSYTLEHAWSKLYLYGWDVEEMLTDVRD